MSDPLSVTISGDTVAALKELVRDALREEMDEHLSPHEHGFLDVDGAAAFLASTPSAIRSLVKRNDIPHYKAPNSRLLFDPDELRDWVSSGSGRAG